MPEIPRKSSPRCPHCHGQSTHVIDTWFRVRDEAVMRRHVCEDCGERFTSQQTVRAA